MEKLKEKRDVDALVISKAREEQRMVSIVKYFAPVSEYRGGIAIVEAKPPDSMASAFSNILLYRVMGILFFL